MERRGWDSELATMLDADLVRMFEMLKQMVVSHDTEVVNLFWVSLFEPSAARPRSSAKLLGG